jgi:hypothetical protein
MRLDSTTADADALATRSDPTALIVTSDAGSVYEPAPSLTCHWDADARGAAAGSIEAITASLEGLSFKSEAAGISARSEGERIYVYHGPQVRLWLKVLT